MLNAYVFYFKNVYLSKCLELTSGKELVMLFQNICISIEVLLIKLPAKSNELLI